MQTKIDIPALIGKKLWRLTLLEDLGKIGNGRMVKCVCECGKTKNLNIYNVISGISKSCGCFHRERAIEAATKHGFGNHPLAQMWRSMKRRCYIKSDARFKYYGAKGVRVCEEWLNDFMSFYNWAIGNGWVEGLHLDKDKLSPFKTGILYSPEFCCFLPRVENMWYTNKSRMVEYKGQVKSLPEWANELGLNYKMLDGRYKSKRWSVERMFETPYHLEFNHNKNINNVS